MKISVITAVYNAEATIGKAIASVAGQRYSEIEHVVVEGKSPDGSLTAIQRVSHNRMRLISEPDEGIYDALNKGIKHATGDVLGFLHSDDVFAHDAVLTHIARAFEDPDVEAVLSRIHHVDRRHARRPDLAAAH